MFSLAPSVLGIRFNVCWPLCMCKLSTRHDVCMYHFCYKHGVHQSVCNVGGLWSHSATKIGNNGTWQDRSVSWLPACQSLDCRKPILWFVILLRKITGVWQNVEFCILAAIISASNGSHDAPSQHLLSFLYLFTYLLTWHQRANICIVVWLSAGVTRLINYRRGQQVAVLILISLFNYPVIN